MSEQIERAQGRPDAEDGELSQTEGELQELYQACEVAKARLLKIALSAEKASPSVAAIYREVSGEVLTLVGDLIRTSAGAFMAVEDRLDDIEDGVAPDISILQQDDADRYIDLLDQILRLLDGLDAVPMASGAEAEEQKTILATLRRMTTEMLEFTKEIRADDPAPDDDDDNDDEAPDALKEGAGAGDA